MTPPSPGCRWLHYSEFSNAVFGRVQRQAQIQNVSSLLNLTVNADYSFFMTNQSSLSNETLDGMMTVVMVAPYVEANYGVAAAFASQTLAVFYNNTPEVIAEVNITCSVILVSEGCCHCHCYCHHARSSW